MVRAKRYRLLLPVLILCAALLQGCGEDGATAAKQPAADFTLKLFDGGGFRLSEQEGRPVVINFFASWCTLCGDEGSGLEKIHREYAERGVVFIGVAVKDTEAKAKAHVKKYGFTFPTGLDADGTIRVAYGIYGLPMTYFIDREGLIHYVHAGAVTEALLKYELGKIL